MRQLLVIAAAALVACDAAPAPDTTDLADTVDLADVGDLAPPADLSSVDPPVDLAQAPDLSTPDVLQCHGGTYLFDFSAGVSCYHSLSRPEFVIQGNKPTGSAGEWLDTLALSFDDSFTAPIATDPPPLSFAHLNVIEAIRWSPYVDLRTDASDNFGGNGSGAIDTFTLAPVGGRVRGTFHATIYQFPVPTGDGGLENSQTFMSCVFDCARTADQ